MNRAIAFLTAALAAASPAQATDVQVREIGPDHFELTIVVEGTTDPAAGEVALAPHGQALCGTKHPHWGHYEFRGDQPAAVGPRSSTSPALRYSQELICDDAPPAPERFPDIPVAPNEPPTQEDEAHVRARTEAFLAAKDTGAYGEAHAMVGASTKNYITPESMAASRTSFNAAAGPGVEREVIRLTWYDDPAGAPTPGRYVAADYHADFPSGAFYCGYLVWVLQYDGSYLVVRQEEGQATPDIVSKASPAEMAALRQQLGCRD